MSKEKMMQLRKSIKSKKPVFIKQCYHKKKRLSQKWKRPNGWQSKIRLNRKGHPKCVTTGYGSPKSVYGLHPTGLEPIKVCSENDLNRIDPKNQGIIISGTVGIRKKLIIIRKAEEKGIRILNIKDSKEFVNNVEEDMKKRKESKTKEEQKKQSEKKKAPAKKEAKEALSEKISEEEKKELEKKEKDKLLTKKEI